ncbi:MAG: HAD family hydrolase [Armatimonadota bacterium]
MAHETLPAPQAVQPVFHRKGAGYFWLFNDRCEWETIDRHLQAFAAADNVMALSIHPRHGLLVPYGGAEWFELVEKTCRRAKELGVQIWLYDEDPWPSGNAGGRLTAEYPELAARGIQQFVYDPNVLDDKTIFYFPTGKLLWCGLVNEETGEVQDLTSRVGVIRRKWAVYEGWDSRFFYPETPLYNFTRCDTVDPEFAVTVSPIPAGMKLMAFVARQAAFAEWSIYGDFIDSLNPRATQRYLESTHEQYKKYVGDLFGTTIEAIFTDEPKMYDPNPYTEGLLEDFRRDMGYDLRPKLHYLFSTSMAPDAVLARLHYRDYIAKRFLDAWMRPVAAWCRENGIKLTGHVSPEDDPVEQALCVGNMLPVMKEMDLAGIDIIIPALGDRRHPVLSVGVTCATAVAQQRGKAGVMTETGHACHHMPAEEIGNIFLWQNMMGVTANVLHCAFLSTRGARDSEPPDFGPDGVLWEGMHDVRRKLAEIQAVTHDARQLAPVAIVWPIRSFNAVRQEGQADNTGGLRRELTTLLADCLDRQVGTHFIDEDDLRDLKVEGNEAVLGRARYTHLVIPSCTVLKAETLATLKALQAQGITVLLTGKTPIMAQTADAILPADLSWCPAGTPADLHRLLDLPGDATDIRCTAWEKDGKVTRLVLNIGTEAFDATIDGKAMRLEPFEVYMM